MTVIITGGELNEHKKNKCCKYINIYKLIEKTSRLAETLEENDQYIKNGYVERMNIDIEYINRILDKINSEVKAEKALAGIEIKEN